MDTLSAWQAAGELVKLNGQNIFVRQGGLKHGQVLVLIHGYPSASWDWQPIWNKLGQHFRLITLDMLGFGFSDKPIGVDYLIREQASLFTSLLKKLDVTDYHILAHDYGDTVAQELLARQLEPIADPKILSCCLLNGGLFPESHRPVLLQKLLLSPLGRVVTLFTTKSALKRNFHKIFGKNTPPSEEVIDGLWQLLMHNNGRRIMPKLIHYIVQRKQNRERWVGALTNAQVPLKYICGMTDPISGAHMAARFDELIADADVCELNDIGHYPQLEAPKQVLDAFFDFHHGQAPHEKPA
ncbi:alpha/beta fold hydrolase [Thalassotalea euphylliae]|uniref:Alpha/beta hydrolase n=1 Tax=Thalassotalea euphylliae TaxID=1655234 RepID=A0A3E0UDU4_9GAMM|nr:alpha/beta hydrolase [Thalassotalea euphylliae]REL35010.1 alpha/beta hydrolase [Thalassotalea euphylliae]